MRYQIQMTEKAAKQLRKFDSYTQSMILSWINKHLVNTDDPFISGKALKGNLGGLWRYRIGDYRIIAEVDNGKLIILIVEVGHRSKVH